MPYIDNNELNSIKNEIKEIKKIIKKLGKINGEPIIQAYSGKRFDLNDHLNVIKLKKTITNIIQNISNNVATNNLLTNKILITDSNDSNKIFKFEWENDKVYGKISRDGGDTWDIKQWWS